MGDLVVRFRAVLLLAGLAAGTVPVFWLARPLLEPAPDTFDTVPLETGLASGLAWALLGCWAWLAATSALVAGETALTGAARHSGKIAPRVVRTLVATACGAGLAGVLAAPALADPIESTPQVHLLDGLSLPDRAMGGMPRAAPAVSRVIVRPGDSLWAIARDHGSDWQSVYRANRSAIGADPDLIQPGTRLVLPPPTHEGSQR